MLLNVNRQTLVTSKTRWLSTVFAPRRGSGNGGSPARCRHLAKYVGGSGAAGANDRRRLQPSCPTPKPGCCSPEFHGTAKDPVLFPAPGYSTRQRDNDNVTTTATDMVTQCIGCHGEAETDYMTCTECGHNYHLGTCSGVSESTFRSKGEQYHRTWKCQTCRVLKARGSDASKQKPDADFALLLATMSRKLDALPALKETVDGIENSIQLMSAKYDEVLRRMENQECEIRNLKKRVETIEEQNNADTIKQLKLEVEELERRSRHQNLEFHGIPKTENEDLLSRVNELVSSKLGVPELVRAEVGAIHRLPSRPDKIPGVIVRFASQQTRDTWLDRRNRLRGTDLYIAENITKQTRALLATTKDWAKQNRYAYAWYKNGKIFLRKRDGDRAFLIRTADDLTTLSR